MKIVREMLDISFGKRNGLSYRSIAQRVGCTPRTAKKYAENPELIGKPRKPAPPRPSKLDAYQDRVAAYVDEDPLCRASTIYDRLCAHGYEGGYEIVKRAVRPLREEALRRAYLRFETDPGAQAQVDFGEFVVQNPDGSVTRYYLFALILGYSRMLYAELLERCDLVSFLEAHQRAFARLGGVPLEILYDRMRNVFLRQLAGKVEFTPALVGFATHYGFRPSVAPAYAPWVKGKVERPMDFVREGFWRGYAFADVATANRDLAAWLAAKAERVHGTTRERVDVRFAREKPHLLALPPSPCDVSERLYREVRKDCTISVDGNRYVMPHTLVGKKLVVRVRHDEMRVYTDDRMVVQYSMPAGKGQLIQDERFYAALRADHAQRARKFRHGWRKGKGRAFPRTKGVAKPARPVEVRRIDTDGPAPVQVQHREMEEYARLLGEVGRG